MKKMLTFSCLILFSFSGFAQQNIMLLPFAPLMDATWKAEGKWKDGKPFKQEINYSWENDGENVKMVTKSYLDTNFASFGHFSDATIFWDTISNSIKFHLKDIHGNLIDGGIQNKKKSIHFNYEYVAENGMKTYMTDALIWIKPDKYMFKVGVLEKDEWKAVYLETYFFKR